MKTERNRWRVRSIAVPRNQPNALGCRVPGFLTVPTQQVPLTFCDVVAFLSFDLGHHPYCGDVLLQFGLGLLNVHLQDLQDVAKPPGSELADASDLSGKGIRLRAEKLPGDVIKFFLATVDAFRQRWTDSSSCGSNTTIRSVKLASS